MFRDENDSVIRKATHMRIRQPRAADAAQSTACAAAISAAIERDSSLMEPLETTVPQRIGTANHATGVSSSASLLINDTPNDGRVHAGADRKQRRQRHRRLLRTTTPSTLLGILTPQSGKVSSANSESSHSDHSGDDDHPLVFSHYDPGLDGISTAHHDLDFAEEETDDSSTDENGLRLHPSRAPYALSPTLCERGIAFFFSRYVSIPNICHQSFDFIYDVWKPPPYSGHQFAEAFDGVTASIVAVGLAGLSKVTGCRDTMTKARHSYGIALSLTQRALQHPKEAATDKTMLAVLILGIYEFLAGRCPQTVRAWKDHVNGAEALASLRGTAQFDTHAGTRMFLMLCHSVLVKCIQSGLPMPKSMVELRNELVRRTESQRRAWQLADPIYRALQMRYDIHCGLITDIDEMLRKLTELDNEFASLLSDLPETWTYRNVELSRDQAAVFGRHCHIYPGQQQVTVWNGLRTVRMLVHETILEQLYTYMATYPSPSAAPLPYQQLLVKTMKMLEMLGDAIIASVPQHFGVVSARGVQMGDYREGASPLAGISSPSRTTRSGRSSRDISPAKQPSPMPPAVSGPTLLDPMKSSNEDGAAETFMTLASTSNTILWPLYILGMSSSCSPEKREYVMDRIDAIYKETKLEQAHTIAGLLESRSDLVMWESIPLDQLPQLPEGSCPSVV